MSLRSPADLRPQAFVAQAGVSLWWEADVEQW
jgi:hypothetical protein